MKIKSIFSGSAILCTALLSGSLVITTRSSSAEPLPPQEQQQSQKQTALDVNTAVGITTDGVNQQGSLGDVVATKIEEQSFVAPPASYVATAYSLRGRTASGQPVSKGVIAADPRFLPLGSRVRLEAGNYSGEYVVADTGGMVKGRRIDIWTPTSREAMRFGRRTVKLTVLSWGGKRKPRTK